MRLVPVPIDRDEARAFIASHHRHNRAPYGYRFAVGASDGERLVGVATCGTPVARLLVDGTTAEVTRCCVIEDAPKGSCSFLYAACWRCWRSMGGRRLVTYTLQTESGASLRGAGATLIAELPPGRTHNNGRAALAASFSPSLVRRSFVGNGRHDGCEIIGRIPQRYAPA